MRIAIRLALHPTTNYFFAHIAKRHINWARSTSMTRFSIECTLPLECETFIGDPNARGTLDIVCSCLAVIFLCTWGVQHLNVPVQTIPQNKRQNFVRSLSRALTKVKWMIFNILAPGWPFAQALCGLIRERKIREAFDDFKTCDKVQWTGSHTQLANMGGFAVRFDQLLQGCTHLGDFTEQNVDAQCVVDEYCCNRG